MNDAQPWRGIVNGALSVRPKPRDPFQNPQEISE
jgi:hypothetical protein